MGVEFEVRAPEVEEVAEGPPAEVALENARRKAHAVAVEAVGWPVLGVDTVVALDGRLYGQPRDEAEARGTLEALSGRTHTVVSGLVIVGDEEPRVGVEETRVTFRRLDEPTLAWYVATGEWRGRAGAYAIQERGGALVRAIEGDYLNVVGLPLALLLDVAPGLLTP